MTTAPSVIRIVPGQPWGRLAIITGVVLAALCATWELHCRAAGYLPGLDDTRDLWVEQRRSVQPEDTVIIGSSRALFDLDLDELERGLGHRPKQLALVGSCVYPVLKDLADDRSFRGTVICDLVPGLLLVPPMAPPYRNAERALERNRSQTIAQRWSHLLSLPLERTFACLQQDDLTLAALLQRVRIPDRAHAQIGPSLPPCFSAIDRDRRTRMLDRLHTDQALRERVRDGWIPLFTPPPKPSWIPDRAFGDFMHGMVEGRFADMAAAVSALHARGARVVFLRLPSGGALRETEERFAPRAVVWERVLRDSGAPGIACEDHAALSGFELPEWSHLSAADSVGFTTRLVPVLRQVLTDGAIR